MLRDRPGTGPVLIAGMARGMGECSAWLEAMGVRGPLSCGWPSAPPDGSGFHMTPATGPRLRGGAAPGRGRHGGNSAGNMS